MRGYASCETVSLLSFHFSLSFLLHFFPFLFFFFLFFSFFFVFVAKHIFLLRYISARVVKHAECISIFFPLRSSLFLRSLFSAITVISHNQSTVRVRLRRSDTLLSFFLFFCYIHCVVVEPKSLCVNRTIRQAFLPPISIFLIYQAARFINSWNLSIYQLFFLLYLARSEHSHDFFYIYI